MGWHSWLVLGSVQMHGGELHQFSTGSSELLGNGLSMAFDC
jgi:hypothetical protein